MCFQNIVIIGVNKVEYYDKIVSFSRPPRVNKLCLYGIIKLSVFLYFCLVLILFSTNVIAHFSDRG